MGNKRGQFNFVWLFAIVAGAAVLVLAIYGATKAGDTMRFQTDTEIAKSLAIITDPLQAGFAEGSFGKIIFRQETRINNVCLDGKFGRHKISVSTRLNIGQEWNIPGEEVPVHNKYIFSSERSTGKEYYVFSKPFEFPYKVADLTMMIPEEYCLVNAPEEIAEEINFNVKNIQVENCSEKGMINVCFGSGNNCDITVYGACTSGCDSVYDMGTVEKFGSTMKYVGNLMWAAIFSEKEIYECNVNRLMYRTGKIAEGFADKADLMDARGCNTNLKPDLVMWAGQTTGAGVENLMSLNSIAETLGNKNDREDCGIWD
ncbi:MAG: hypothetical protein KKF50_03660 [Nanoarchaeota archaeon]|nr:hypothetical protein [Nanoarchaeota archaeon]